MTQQEVLDPYSGEAWRAKARAESRGGFPIADQGFSSIQGTLFDCYIWIAFDACNIYLHQARTNANDNVTVKDYIFYKTSRIELNTQI